MRLLALSLSMLSYCFISSHAHRDGAQEESCYNHSIIHDGAFFATCGAGCRFFLNVKEVVNETTLELGNETSSYECGKVYGIEVANNLNAPEGYLVQARDGTEDTSEIIGTFLDPSVVQQRNPTVPVNFRILRCRSSSSSSGELLDNSATHPRTVNMAGILQLYWQAPDCSNRDLPNVTLWFTIVQQLTVVFNPSKSTVLTFIPPPLPPTTTSALTTTTSSPTTTLPQTEPPSNESSGALTIGAIIGIAVGGGLGIALLAAVILILTVITVCCCGPKRSSSKKDASDYSNGKVDEGFTSPVFESVNNAPQEVVGMNTSITTFKTEC